VNGASTGQTLSVQRSELHDRIHCRRCGSERVFRIQREGFWRERILPLLGIYPWRCKLCREEILMHKRYRSRIGKTKI